MYCPNCGNKLPEDGSFCPTCGARIAVRSAAQPDSTSQASSDFQQGPSNQSQQAEPVVETPYIPGTQYGHTSQSPRRHSGVVVGIIIAVVALTLITAVVTASCVALSFGARARTTPSIGSLIKTTHDVTFIVSGLDDTDENSSHIPLRITGTDIDGNKIDKTIFLPYSGVDTQLPEGTYEAQVLGSPISSNGTIYEYPTRSIQFKISGLAPNEGYMLPNSKVLKFEAIQPEGMTDEKVQDALSWARKDEESGVDVGKLEEAMKKRRESAEKPQEEESAKPEEEAAPEESAEQPE